LLQTLDYGSSTAVCSLKSSDAVPTLFTFHLNRFISGNFFAILRKPEEHIDSGCVQWNHLRIVLVAPGHPSPESSSPALSASAVYAGKQMTIAVH
jgi:hypothetical protein